MSSSFIKNQLKTARESIANKNFEYAEGLCKDILENDPTNYNALVFLALSLKELNQIQESESAYEKAIDAQPANTLAFTGLLKLYQSQNNVQGQLKTWSRLAHFYLKGNEGEKLLESLEKRLELARGSGDNQDDELIMQLLQEYLPSSPAYPLIKDLANVPPPSSVLNVIIEMKEKRLKEIMTKELSERRMRLGSSPLPILKVEVEAEFILASDLDTHYADILKYLSPNEADQLFKIQEKMLDFLVKRLRHLKKSQKRECKVKVIELVESILKPPPSRSSSSRFSSLACALSVECQNCGLGSKDLKILEAYKNDIMRNEQDSKCLVLKTLIKYSTEQTLDEESIANLLQQIEEGEDDYLSLVIMSDYYLNTKEYVSALDFGARAEKVIEIYQANYDFDLGVLIMEMKLLVASCSALIGDTIKALDIYKTIVKQNPDLKAGLLGLGKVYVEIKNLHEARTCFERIISNSPDDLDARFEIGWVLFLEGNLAKALNIFKSLLQSTSSSGLAYYRLARVYWEMGGEFREDKTYTHAHLIQAVKIDPSFSPSFSFLGDYYRIQENDLVRAMKCYTKAVSINPTDSDAAQSLCSIWISQGKLKEATDLLQQFIEVIPRSKWAWKQLGILELTESPASAITRFQTSLRILPDDSVSWSCLGDAYAREGKYVAALKALDRAKELDPAEYSADFLKARVHQKLGQYEESLACYKSVLSQIPLHNEPEATRIPVLHGVAETRLLYARELHEQGSYGACLKNLCLILSVICSERVCDASFLKIAGDACLAMYRLLPMMISDHVAKLAFDCIDIISSFGKVKANSISLVSSAAVSPHTVNLHRVLDCAYLCYQSCIIQTSPDDKSILGAFYYDISLSSYYLCEATRQDDYIIEAIRFVKTSLYFRPSFWLYWNALGIFCQKVDKKLAQHSFIKAIECDATNATPWCNLGFFYLVSQDFELADQCFQKAQFVDLDYPFGWLGQAITSELLGHEKTFELFEHSFELARVSNGDILYQFSKQCYLYPGHHTTPLASAAFALQKCYEMHFRNPQLLNLYGLVLEQQHRVKLAIDMFIEALSLLSDDEDASSTALKNAIHENLGRCLCTEGKFQESISSFQNIGEDGRDAYTLTGLGLAYFMNHDHLESLNTFQKALAVSEGAGGKDVLLVNNVNLVLSQVLFALGSDEHIALAKQQLLSCFASDSRFVPALLGLCAMGVVLKDWTLAQTAAAELIKLEPHIIDDLDADVDFVLGCIFAASNQTTTVKRFLAKSIHRCPWKAMRWSKMAEFIYSSDLTSLSKVATLLSQNALVIASQIQTSLKPDLQSTNTMSDALRIAALSLLSAGGVAGAPHKSQRYLSKAILLNPTLAKNWLAMSIDVASRGYDDTVVFKTACATQAFDTGLVGIWSEAMKIHLILLEGQKAGKHNEIQAALAVLDGICSNSTGLLQVVGYCLMGRGLQLLQNSQAAIQALQQAISIASSSTPTSWKYPWYLLSKLLSELDQIPSAIEVLKSCGDGDTCARILEASLCMMNGTDGRAAAFEIVGDVMRRSVHSAPAKFLQTLILAQNQELQQEEASRKKGLARIVKARSQLIEEELGREALEYLDSFISRSM